MRLIAVEVMRLPATILLLTITLFAAPPEWKPANFRGLTMGRAHREDAVRTLGAPDASTRTATGEELIYNGKGDHKGSLTIRLDHSGLVVEVQESLPIAIPRTQMYKEFGKDAQTAQFSWAKCKTEVLYRDPRGPLELMLYPSRGIVLWPDQFGYDFAAVHYLAHPPGLRHKPACTATR